MIRLNSVITKKDVIAMMAVKGDPEFENKADDIENEPPLDLDLAQMGIAAKMLKA